MPDILSWATVMRIKSMTHVGSALVSCASPFYVGLLFVMLDFVY
jgi:hypothetical protein